MTQSLPHPLIALFLGVGLAASPARAQSDDQSAIEALERATMIVEAHTGASVLVDGMGGPPMPGLQTRRVAGIAIEDDLIVVAAGAIEGASYWTVIDPGASEREDAPAAFAAHPVHVDAASDVAFLRVDGVLSATHPLPGPRTPEAGEWLTFAGYGQAGRELGRSFGTVVGAEPDGALRLRLELDRTHPAGLFLADEAGRWVAIMSADSPQRGTTIGAVSEAWARRPATARSFRPAERLVARVTRLHHARPSSPAPFRALVRDALDLEEPEPEADAIVAVYATSAVVRLRAQPGVDEASGATERALTRAVVALAERALRRGPHLRFAYIALPLVAAGWPTPDAAPARRQRETIPQPQLVIRVGPRTGQRRGTGGSVRATTTSSSRLRGPGRGTVPGLGPEPPPSTHLPESGAPSWRRAFPVR